ncbi:MAG: hypothetical protein IT185_12340 [Acidobacteria bacterium]|nr:hypothetical protein [Acidobacteriota bacterium]
MKFLVCQISLTALLFAQRPHEAKMKAICDHIEREYTYLTDQPTEAYLQSLVNRIGQATIRIVDESESWADFTPCRTVLVTKGFLQKAASEGELAETIAHMIAHSDQPPTISPSSGIPLIHRPHHPRSISPGRFIPQYQQLEADANRRATELLASFTADPDSSGLKAFQQNHPPPVQKKPTLYR